MNFLTHSEKLKPGLQLGTDTGLAKTSTLTSNGHFYLPSDVRRGSGTSKVCKEKRT